MQSQQEQQHRLLARVIGLGRDEYGQQQSQTRRRLQALPAHERWQALDLAADPLTTAAAVPSVEELAAVVRGARSPYVDIRTPAMHAQLRVSRVPFRYHDLRLARLDVVQVKTSALFRGRGVFGRFLERLTTVANNMERIVFIECVIGPALLKYIRKRPYDFYLVPYSENNYVYLPSVRTVSPATYRSLVAEAQARTIAEARQRQDANRSRFDFYTF